MAFLNNWKKFSVTREMKNENMGRKLESDPKGHRGHTRESGVEDISSEQSYDQFAFQKDHWTQDLENQFKKGRNGGRIHLIVIQERNDASKAEVMMEGMESSASVYEILEKQNLQVWTLELKERHMSMITLRLLTWVEGDGFHSDREHIEDDELSQTCSNRTVQYATIRS